MFYYRIETCLASIFVDFYVSTGPISAFKKAREEYPELTDLDLRCIGYGKAKETHVSNYRFN